MPLDTSKLWELAKLREAGYLTQEEFNSEKAKLLASVPLGRLPTATEQENVVCFLASDHASYVTGQTIDVNGGQR